MWLKNVLGIFDQTLINRIWKNRYSYETVGNYVYKLSEKELEKIAMGINLPAIGIKGINDYYSEDIDLNQSTSNKAIFNKVKSKIARRDLICKMRLIPYKIAARVIFKQLPSPAVK